ncbi:MAG: hypothetical protein AB8C13_03355 [Phycisphaerales bacterium]
MTQYPQPTNWKRIKLTAFMVGVAAIASVFIIRSIVDDIPFDSQRWKDQASVSNGTDLRSQMINDLQGNVLMRGMQRSDVLLLLGKPDAGFFSADYDLAYRIGSNAGVGAVTRHGSAVSSGGGIRLLTLKFNDRDRLIEWKVVMR